MELTDIQRSLQLFAHEAGLVEIRALGCWDWKPDVLSTQSGYFDAQHLAEAEQAALHLETSFHASGVYVTLNPASPDLLARSANRVKKAQRDGTTKDGEIVSRRWMLIDIDPTRPAGVSSTDAELATAQAQARECQEWLHDNGWPSPVVAMSGNGWHLLYRVDLPPDDKTIELCLKALAAKFPQVDTSTFNAARITKLYGTLARKGDSTHDRPHRRSKLVNVPDNLQVVHAECLNWLANQAPQKPGTSGSQGSGDSVDLASYLRNRGVPVIREDIWNGARRFFIRCPGIESHSSKNADSDCSIWQDSSGMLAGKCFHDSCGFKSWSDFTGYFGQVKPEDFPNPVPVVAGDIPAVDPMGGEPVPTPTVTVTSVSRPAVRKAPVDPNKITDEFFEIPGLIGEMVKHHKQFAPRPQPALSLIASEVLVGTFSGRKIQTESGLRTNIYGIGLAPSGSGKERPRADNIAAVTQAGCTQYLGAENPSSDVALIGELEDQPSLLMQIDEVAKFFATTRGPSANVSSHLKALNTKFLELTGAAQNPAWVPKSWADRSKKKTIAFPHLCIYGTSTIEGFWNCVTNADAADGFLARMLVVEAEEHHPRLRMVKSSPIPQVVVDILKDWDRFVAGKGDMSDKEPSAVVVPNDPDAFERLSDHMNAIEDQLPKDPKEHRPIWSRCSASAQKLALIFAASRGPFGIRVTLADAEAAVRQANWSTRLMINRIFSQVADNEEDRNKKKLLKIIRDHGPAPLSVITRKTQFLTGYVRDGMLKDLIAAELIEATTLPASKRGGQGTTVYSSIA
ncbi:DUF3987 domain-containing protein [Schlesneria sp. T3-172]|uniref:DUF3987 domain-containing protein n=1 Tax=Schlesneria sphaerica TaxID=3373610 RepID=UPI0037CC0C48